MYRVKKSVRLGQRVILTNNFKPSGRKIYLDNATQDQLKYLYELNHNFIEYIPDTNGKRQPDDKKIPEAKEPERKEIRIERSDEEIHKTKESKNKK